MTAPSRIVVLSGAGLSKASGIPTFRDADGLWEGYRVEEVATPEAWVRDAELVRNFYDVRRVNCTHVLPNAGHEALARLQHRLGPDRVTLVTQNIDGLLQKAGAADVIEMHGSLFRLRCEHDGRHPMVQVAGAQSRTARCARCGGRLRPAVVWFGEEPVEMDRILDAISRCDTFVSVGTSGVVYPAAGFASIARRFGKHTIEVNPITTGAVFDEVIAEPAEEALPRLVDRWLDG
jgi:NAD-dependent deacetylase